MKDPLPASTPELAARRLPAIQQGGLRRRHSAGGAYAHSLVALEELKDASSAER